MELVSVVIPCFNQGIYIEECVQSVISQTYENIEIIIVNDGSTDEYTLVKLKELNDKFDTISLIDIVNSGVSKARNVGILESKGAYILPLDGDDKIHKNYIKECVEILDSNSDIGVVYSIAHCFGYKNGIFVLDDYEVDVLLRRNLVFCSAMFRKSDFFKTNGYNTNMIFGYEDWDLWISFAELGVNFYRINKIRFYYRIKEVSRNVNTSELRKKEAMIMKIIDNHREFYQKYNISIHDVLKHHKLGKLQYHFVKVKLLFKLLLNKEIKSLMEVIHEK